MEQVIKKVRQMPGHCLACPYLLNKMGSCQYPGTTYFDVFVSTLPYLTALVIVPILFLARRRISYIGVQVILVTSYIFADKVLKNIIQDLRPEGACKQTFGFPSSHMVVTGALAYMLLKRSALLSLVLSCLQGHSRYVLRYHNVRQIVAGWVFGVLFAFVATKILMSLYLRFGSRVVPKFKFLVDDLGQNICPPTTFKQQ